MSTSSDMSSVVDIKTDNSMFKRMACEVNKLRYVVSGSHQTIRNCLREHPHWPDPRRRLLPVTIPFNCNSNEQKDHLGSEVSGLLERLGRYHQWTKGPFRVASEVSGLWERQRLYHQWTKGPFRVASEVSGLLDRLWLYHQRTKGSFRVAPEVSGLLERLGRYHQWTKGPFRVASEVSGSLERLGLYHQ